MAIVKFGALVDAVRGSIGGITFSAGGSGPLVKLYNRGPRKRSELQNTVRANLGTLIGYWRSLDQGQRDDWDTYAADPAQEKTNSLGEAYYTSGWQWFCACNHNLLMREEDVIEDAPVLGTPTAPAVTAVLFAQYLGQPIARVAYTIASWGATEAGIFDAGYARSGAGKTSVSGYYNLARVYHPTGSYKELKTEVVARWGAPQVGDRLFFRTWRESEEGRRSAPDMRYATYYVIS